MPLFITACFFSCTQLSTVNTCFATGKFLKPQGSDTKIDSYSTHDDYSPCVLKQLHDRIFYQRLCRIYYAYYTVIIIQRYENNCCVFCDLDKFKSVLQ